MPFGDYTNFDDCVSKNKDKGNPEAFCADLYKKITGEWPSAVKSMVIDMIADFQEKNPETDISVKTVNDIISRIDGWSGTIEDFFAQDISQTSPDLGGPIVIKSKVKRVVVGPVLIPGEADHEGESLTAEKIEDVAYQFMSDFRYIDLAHSLKQVGIPVSSDVLRQPETHLLQDGTNLELPVGTWMLGVKVEDPETWKAVESGAMKGFSIMGVSRQTLEAAGKSADGMPLGHRIENGQVKKILLSDLGPDWVAIAVSILPNPSVFKSRFIAVKEANPSLGERMTRFFKRFVIKGNPDQKSDNDNKSNMEENDMEPKEVQELIDKSLGPVMDEIKKLTSPPKTDPEPEAKTDGTADPDAQDGDGEDKTKTPDPPDVDGLKAQVEAVAGEVEAVKGTLTDINKTLKDLSAVKSQGLPQDGTGGGGQADHPALTKVNRDVFGRSR